MHIRRSLLVSARVGLIFPLAALSGAAQAPTAATEILMQRCDRLSVVILQVDKEEKRFLVDTAATSFLNAKSLIGGHAKEVQIHSWNEMTILHASDISIGEHCGAKPITPWQRCRRWACKVHGAAQFAVGGVGHLAETAGARGSSGRR
jgi:hypothetical protein